MSLPVCIAVALGACAAFQDAQPHVGIAAGAELDPYAVGLGSPRLTTPRWVGEEGVEAVVVLAIDDMSDNPEKYETFLRPILDRLKQIDGRAPVSIMANRIDPTHPQMQVWLKEGLSIEVHTLDHPCPLLQGHDFATAARRYHDGIDLIARIPNSRPVAFRTPCCDSQNTVSPRFFAELMARPTREGRYLSIDSSVFCLLTPDDPALPRDLVLESDGRERFRKYVPFKSFKNLIENYPYPYLIAGACFEFPCIVPSDWEAQNLQKPNNPKTVEDLKAALDAVVLKQGVMNLVFHPHGWIENRQLVQLIDHAVAAHGKKVKFLNFREALDRLERNVLGGKPLREADPALLAKLAGGTPAPAPDLDSDGYPDFVRSDHKGFEVALYDPVTGGMNRKVSQGTRQDPQALPLITRQDGTNNGFFFHSGTLWWQNEDTAELPDLVDRRHAADLLANISPRPRSPDEERRSFRIRPGFKVELVAAEPLVHDPIAFDWDERGRLWVVEIGDYPLGGDGHGSPAGQVRLLEDTDRNGAYDKASLFLEGLEYPTGVMPWRDGVLVSCAPEILFAADRDGDGKADVREAILTGFRRANPQHRVNGFALGLDGWVHAANASADRGIHSPRTGKTIQANGRDFRFQPDTGAVEAESGESQFGRNRDDLGRWFGNDNSTWAWHYVLSDRDIARNASFALAQGARQVLEPNTELFPIAPLPRRFNDPEMLGRATSACSPTPYRDTLFGSAFQNNLFISEPVHNLIHRLVLSTSGASFSARPFPDETGREFLAAADPMFRPTALKTGPDGALYIADMYRLVIEHPEWIPDDIESQIDLRLGHDKGRIWRVVPIHTPSRPFTPFDRANPAQLVAALDDTNGWRRDTAMRLLWERGEADPDLVRAITRLAAGAASPPGRIQALAALATLGRLEPELACIAIGDPDPDVRAQAIERARPLLDSASTVLDAMLIRANDDHPRVRLASALALGDTTDPRAAQALASLLIRDRGDSWIRASILSSARHHAVAMLESVLTGAPNPDPRVVEQLAALAARDSRTLVQLWKKATTPAEVSLAPWQFAAALGVLEAAARRDPELVSVLSSRDEPPDAFTKRLQALRAGCRQRLADSALAESDRRLAARMLGLARPTPEDHAALVDLLTPRTPDSIQVSSLESLLRTGEASAVQAILERWRSFSPALRNAVAARFLERPTWTTALLDAIESGAVNRSELDAGTRNRLLAQPDPGIRQRASALVASASPDRVAVVDKLRTSIRSLPTDPLQGAQVFRQQCFKCHRYQGEGSWVGPDLNVLTDRSTESLLIAILDPNRAIEDKYHAYALALADGRTLSGVIAQESANSVTLRTENDQDTVVLRADIDELASTGQSLMPIGIENELKEQDLANLIAYLQLKKAPRREFPGNAPSLVRAETGGVLSLPASLAEIYGSTLVFEPKYQNLGFWQSANDHAIWMVQVEKPGTYELALDYACPDSAAGNRLWLDTAASRIEFLVPSTGSWDTYRKTPVGRVSLEPGVQKLEIRPAGPVQNALLDLKSVELRPVAP
jgi:putative membrane-bound dehydrogenase-like protein